MQSNEELFENVEYSENEAERYRKLKLIADIYNARSLIEREDIQDDGSDHEQSQLESVQEGDKNRILKSLLFLPYNRVWIIFQHMGIIILSCILLATLGIVKFTKKQITSLVTVQIILDAFYSVDFFLSLIYRQLTSLNTTCYYQPRAIWRLVLAVLSLIPLEQIYKTFSSKPDEKLYPVFSINRLLRLHFLYIYFLRNRFSITEDSIFLRIWRYGSFFIIFSHLAIPMLLFYSECDIKTEENCENTWIFYYMNYTTEFQGPKLFKITTNEDMYWITLFVTVGRITTNGFVGGTAWKVKADFAVFCFLSILALILHIPVTNAPNTLNFVHARYVSSTFMEKLNIILLYLSDKNVDKALIKRVKDNYDICWINYKGLRRVEIPNFIPTVARRSLSLDIFWEAFQHTHIFRECDVSFLRVLAPYFQTMFYLPGDIICKKYELKTKLIYVVTGVIQILSEEDDQTPVISLGGGTCLGEITLMMSYKSTTILKCATYCELYILDRQIYCSYLTNYPYHQKSMQKYAMHRFESAKILHYISSFLRSGQKTNIYSETTIAWVNTELHKLMEMENKTLMDDNLFSEGDTSIYDSVQHTAEYLDLLVLCEELELETQRVCLRGHFPWMLHPNSVFVKSWNIIVIITVLVLTILIPQNAVYTQSESLYITILIITIVFLVDIYVQLTTAIKTKDELIVDMRKILYLRFMQLSFIVDLIGSLPVELFTYILYENEDKLSVLCYLQLNRLILLWKIESNFREIENTLRIKMHALYFIKYSVYILLLIYLYACFLFHETCDNKRRCNPYGWLRTWHTIPSNESSFIIPYYYSTMIMTGISLKDIQPANIKDMKYALVGFVISSLLFVTLLTGTTALCIIVRFQWKEYLGIVKRIQHFMVTREIDTKIQERVQKFLEMEWQQHRGIAVLKHGVLSDMPTYLKDEVNIAMCASAIKQVKYFEDISEEFINKLATLAVVSLIPENETVTYAGNVTQNMYMILNGYCEILSSDNSVIKVIGPNCNFSGVEMLFEIPEPHTVRTLTTCNIIILSKDQFSRAFSVFPEIEDEFLSIIKDLQIIKKELGDIINVTYKEPEQLKKKITKKSIYYFGYMLKKHTPRGDDYLKPFDKLLIPLNFIRYLMLRFTFLPDGKFIKYWELSRIIFAVISAFAFPTFTLFDVSGYEIIGDMKYVLDTLAYLDLYVRMHTCYYTKEGILVKHPLKTAIHYFKNGFLLDFLACVPIEIFYTTETTHQYNKRGFLIYNRILQIHRVFSAIRYKNYDPNVANIYNFVKYLPILLITINVSGMLLVKGVCDFFPYFNATENYTQGVFCGAESWITQSGYSKYYGKLSPFQVYLLGLYLAVSMIFRIGLPGVLPQVMKEFLHFSIIAILGYIIIMLFTGIIAASRIHSNVELISYQEEMKSMTQFMEKRQIPYNLRKEAIVYFETLWKSKRGYAAHEILNHLHPSLKFDALYNMYRSSINLRSVLFGENKAFYHSLLNNSLTEFYVKQSKICEINDINDKFYILHKGRVEVKSANGNRLAVLYPGAIFGNIKNIIRARLSIAVLTMGQVELLVLQTRIFYDVLSCYPKMKRRFDLVTKLHADYIPSIETGDKDNAEKIHFTDTLESISVLSSSGQHRIIEPDSLLYTLWETGALIIGGYVSFAIIVYQICAQDYMLRLFLITYFFDLCYLVKPYLKLRLAYENESGEMVTNIALIRRRYFRSVLGLPLDVLTIAPFELFALLFPSNKLFYVALFRINRLPRILMVFEYFESRKHKLNVRVFATRFSFAFAWWTLTIHTLVCIQIFRLCFLMGCSTVANYTESYLHLYLMITYEIMGISSTSTFVTILNYDTTLFLYYLFCSILCYYCLALFLGEFISAIDMVTFSLSKYVTEMNKLRVSMEKHNSSPSIYSRIWNYVTLLWDQQRGRQYPNLLINAPYNLKEKINMCIYSQHLMNCYIFSNCEKDLLRQIVGKMMEMTFFPGNYITFEGDMDETMYFIHRGKVEVFIEEELTSVFKEVLHEGEVFGLTQGLLQSMPHDYTYRAKTEVVIIALIRSKWNNILEFFPASKESLYEMIHDLI